MGKLISPSVISNSPITNITGVITLAWLNWFRAVRDYIFGINTISSLQSVAGEVDGQQITINGYSSEGDGGGGTFYWNANSTASDNGGTIIAPIGVSTGRWYRLYSGPVNVMWFGAKGDGVTDDTAAIQSCINNNPSATIEFGFSTNNFKCTGPILLVDANGHNFQGVLDGKLATISFTNAGSSSDTDAAMQHGFQVYPTLNAIGGDTTGLREAQFRNLTINCPTHGAGIYLANSQNVTIANCQFQNGRYSIAMECCINTTLFKCLFNNFTNAGIGLIMSSNTANVWYGSVTPSTSYWNDSPSIIGCQFAATAVGGLAHILDMGSQAESIRLIEGCLFFSGANADTQYGYVGRNGNPMFHSCWWENINYPIRILNTNAAEGGSSTTLTGVTGAEPSGTYQIGNIPDGFSYTCNIQGCFTSKAINDFNLSGVTGAPCFVGQNISELLTGFHILSTGGSSQEILDVGDVLVSPSGGAYKSLTNNQYASLYGLWETYTPTVTSGTGTISAYTINTAKFVRKAHEIEVFFDITINTNGTGAGNIIVTLPSNTSGGVGVLSGRETVSTGNMLVGTISSSNANIWTYNNGYPGGTGNRLVVQGHYSTTW